MAHRKYDAPRHGSLGFLPKKRCQRKKGKIRSFPRDNPSVSCHLTASIGYKAGMTHVVREIDIPGSKLDKKDVVEGVSIIETPPIDIVGIVGYIKTSRGLRAFKTFWSNDIKDEFKRNFYKNWYKSKKKAFSKYQITHSKEEKHHKKIICEKIKKYCSVIRCIGSSGVTVTGLSQKKSNIQEIQINGGTISEKISFCLKIFNKKIPINSIFRQNELIDVIGITKGKGFEGVITRWGVTRLPRKTHRGARKVACVGAWHPSRVSYTVPRAGQNGFHHRTQLNLKIYRIGKAGDSSGGTTDFDVTEKSITPMGGFPYYGEVKNDFLIVKGGVTGSKKRSLVLRKTISYKKGKNINENIILKFIDTSSKWGHGRFQTSSEKKKYFGRI
mmetsp:Transcript_51275/g.104274  ORF Transcript_51275/g.104274 Transcript_51275/m.104274 type:complete len:385 (-) Transcript_51275:4213-5367(-)